MARYVVLILSAWCCAACANRSLDAIDRDVQRTIARYHREALGASGETDDRQLQRPAIDVPARAYRDDLATPNPAANELPIEARPPVDRDGALPQMPRMLDDDTDAPRMDLESLLAYAIEHSRDYRTAKEQLFIAVLELLAEEHLWGPRFFNTTTAAFNGTPESGDHDQALGVINTFTVTQRLPYGGEVSASALVDVVTMLRDAGTADDGQSAALTLSATLPLLRDAGIAARDDRIQARRNVVYAVRRFERFRREFLLQVSTQYYDLIRQQKQIENLERQVTNFNWLSARIEALADAGREAYFEVQRAQQQVLFASNNLINAQERYVAVLDSFKILIGKATGDPLAIEPTEIVIPEPATEPAQAVATAHQLRLDLQTSGDLVDDAKRRVAVARNRTLPDLDLFADVILRTDADKKRGGVDFELEDSDYTAGVTFGMPLDREIENIGVRRAMINAERTDRTYTLLRDRIAADVRQSIREIEQARFTLELQSRNLDIADKRLRGVLLRLRSLGPRDFIEAQEDLLEAENRRDAAERDLRVSILQFLLDTGQLRVGPDGQWRPPANLQPAATSTRESRAADMIGANDADPSTMDPGEESGGGVSGGPGGPENQ
jgi:outer membrane protein TolC